MSDAIVVPSGFSVAACGNPRERGWTIAVMAAALLVSALIVVGIAQLAREPDLAVTLVAVSILTVAAAVTWCIHTVWSRRVRFLLELLERVLPGSSVWKALGSSANARTLRRLAEDTRFMSQTDMTRTGLYAVFGDNSLTLWRRRGGELQMMASIPRDAIRFEYRELMGGPGFVFSVLDGAGGHLPFVLGLTRGRLRRGIRDADAAHTIAAHWCRG